MAKKAWNFRKFQSDEQFNWDRAWKNKKEQEQESK